MKKAIAYQCEFCSRYGKNQSRIRKHEDRCYFNPGTHSCGSCGHLSDWNCRKGLEFIKEEGRQTPTLRTNCPVYENLDDMIYGPEEDLMSN